MIRSHLITISVSATAITAALFTSACKLPERSTAPNRQPGVASSPNPTCLPIGSPACGATPTPTPSITITPSPSASPTIPYSANGPVIFYTDIISGPNTGGENNNGVFLTIFGKGFGATQGTSKVTVGDLALGEVAAYKIWSDTKVVVQIGPRAQTGSVVLTTSVGSAATSEAFTVRPGRIFFVSANSPSTPGSGTYADPWRLADNFYDIAAAGDIVYLRAGTYSGEYGYTGWGSVFGLRSGVGGGLTATGTSTNPIAYLGYPSETVTLDAASTGGPQIGFRAIPTAPDWIVIGNFKIVAYSDCIDAGTTKGWRIVNNECHGITRTTALWGGSISPGSDHAKVLGNTVTGGRSASKMDHAIYSGACASEIEIAWNKIYDNNFARGPLIVVNYEGQRCASGQYAGTALIHDNIVDSTNYPSRCIGIYTQSYQNGDPVIPVSIVYNNVLINCGVVDADGPQAAMLVGNGAAQFYHNTLYNTNTMAIDLGGFEAFIPYVNVGHNIFHMKPSAIAYFTYGNLGGYLHPENNLYFGLSASTGDSHAITNLDPLFVAPSSLDFHLQPGSPAIGAGTTSGSSTPAKDFDGIPRPSSGFDLGAYQSGERL